MRILVTGGAGFIGSNLIEELLKQGYFVRCLDNLSTGKIKNIEPYFLNKNFEFIEGDIRNFDSCNSATDSIDIISHQAALGSVPRSILDPISSNESNVTGFLNILIAAVDQNVKRIIFASSSSVYGDTNSSPKEEDITGRLLSPYAATKKINEIYADIFNAVHNLNYVGFRYFNVFGPKQDPNGVYAAVIPKFITQILNKKSPIINGDGSYSRDFTFIENVVDANLRAIKSDNENALNKIYNVACGNNFTILELFDQIKESIVDKLGYEFSSIQPTFGSPRKGDIPHSIASIHKIKSNLNYIPGVGFKDGIEKTIDWYLKQNK